VKTLAVDVDFIEQSRQEFIKFCCRLKLSNQLLLHHLLVLHKHFNNLFCCFHDNLFSTFFKLKQALKKHELLILARCWKAITGIYESTEKLEIRTPSS